MNDRYLTALKARVANRARHVLKAEFTYFHAYLAQFLAFLDTEPVTKVLVEQIRKDKPLRENAGNFVNKKFQDRLPLPNFAEHARFAFSVMEVIRDSQTNLAAEVMGGGKVDERLQGFKDVMLSPFLDYLDEYLEDQSATAYLLYRYKQRCEWFDRKELFEAATAPPEKGKKARKPEEVLVHHFTKYLFDNGKQFVAEPKSEDGYVDILVAGGYVADAKVFVDDVSKIKKAAHQVYNYARSHKETSAYVVIYEIANRHLECQLDRQDGIPFICYGGCVIYFLTIDVLYPHPSASELGKISSAALTAESIVEELKKPFA